MSACRQNEHVEHNELNLLHLDYEYCSAIFLSAIIRWLYNLYCECKREYVNGYVCAQHIFPPRVSAAHTDANLYCSKPKQTYTQQTHLYNWCAFLMLTFTEGNLL